MDAARTSDQITRGMEMALRLAAKAAKFLLKQLWKVLLSSLGPLGLLAVMGALLALAVVGAVSGGLFLGPADTSGSARQNAQAAQAIYQPAVDALAAKVGASTPQLKGWLPPWELLAALDVVSDVPSSDAGKTAPADAWALRPIFTYQQATIHVVIDTTTVEHIIGPHGNIKTVTVHSQSVKNTPENILTRVNAWDGIYAMQYQSKAQSQTNGPVVKRNGDIVTQTVTTTEPREVGVQHVPNLERLQNWLPQRPHPILASDMFVVLQVIATEAGLPADYANMSPSVYADILPIPAPSGSTVQRVLHWASLINAAAAQYQLPPALVAAVMAQESGGDPSAGSSAGAIGLMQIMPDKVLPTQNPWAPATNIDAGASYLAAQMAAFGNSQPLALAAYNAGPGAVEEYDGIPPYAQTQRYVPAVLGYEQIFASKPAFSSSAAAS